MHITDVQTGNLGANGIGGFGLPIAVGRFRPSGSGTAT